VNITNASGDPGTPQMGWCALQGQDFELPYDTAPPRHHATPDCSLDDALSHWKGGHSKAVPACPDGAWRVYLRGTLPQVEAGPLLAGSVFDKLRATASFGLEPFRVSLYASQKGLQTNLHADEHSGFLVQVVGQKRVVLFSRRKARRLRCRDWGDVSSPINRRSWYDDGVPDVHGWSQCPPFDGLDGVEVEVGPGEALYIPKGYFHDVLSRCSDTLGLVLRCSD